MGLLTAKTGAEDLRAWLASRAKLADQVMQPEEALLGGRFVRYAARRLFAFSLARAWTIVLHVVELTWLAEVFTAKTFVASIALQNVTLVIDAAYWGALEAMRRRVRALGPSSEAAALVTRWLSVSIWAGAAIALVPLARAVYGAIADDRVPSMLHVYALVCALRLGADVVIRTYYSGVYAHRRVHRPVWSVFAPPLVLVAVTFATWNAAGGWSFPIALVASAIVSRGLLFGFTRRAYRVQRVPSPRVRLLPRLAIPDLSTVKDAVLGAVANLTTRLGAVILLAAVIPSLSGVDDDPLAPFAFALHLAAPALSLSAQWGLLFYHDHKRLEDEPSHALAHALHVRLLACGAVLGVFAWAATCGITAWFVPLAEVWPTLAALLPATVGLSIWTGLQIRGFARGDFATQAISAGTMLLALWGALSAEWTGPVAWYLALGASPWVAIALHVMLARFFARRGEVATLPSFARALGATKGEVVAWWADCASRAPLVEHHLAAALGTRGAIVRVRDRLVWFERVAEEPTRRLVWLRACSGALEELASTRVGAAHEVLAELASRGVLDDRANHDDDDALAAAHARLFPKGFALVVGRAPPETFAALAPSMRQAVWSDALRDLRRRRGGGAAKSQRAWYVTAHAPDGPIRAIFGAPRPVDPAKAQAWRSELLKTRATGAKRDIVAQ